MFQTIVFLYLFQIFGDVDIKTRRKSVGYDSLALHLEPGFQHVEV